MIVTMPSADPIDIFEASPTELGIAWKDGKDKGATGRPVPLLATWLLAQEGNTPQG